MMRAFLSASHSTKPTRSNVMMPLRTAPSATVANSSSERTTDPVRRTLTPCSGVSPSLDVTSRIAAVALRPGCRSSKLRTGDQFTLGESRALSFRQAFECISERGEGGLEVFQLCFAQAHTLERLRQRT